MNLRDLQEQHLAWSSYNFGKVKGDRSKAPLGMLGVMEELGELAHAMLKQHQNIRGTSAEHEEKMKDSVGDLVVFLADVCTSLGFDMQEIVETTWTEVSKRDWVKYPKTGLPPSNDHSPKTSDDPWNIIDFYANKQSRENVKIIIQDMKDNPAPDVDQMIREAIAEDDEMYKRFGMTEEEMKKRQGDE